MDKKSVNEGVCNLRALYEMLLGALIMGDEVGWVCITRGRDEKFIQHFNLRTGREDSSKEAGM
jgi:hypothetical protein